MPGKRSPEKLIAKRRAFEQQPPATKDAWLAAAANDKRVKEERKRNEEMGEDFNRARRAQYWTGVQQQAESERLERWNKALHQWDAQVNEDARHESIARQQALAGRMVAIACVYESLIYIFGNPVHSFSITPLHLNLGIGIELIDSILAEMTRYDFGCSRRVRIGTWR